ncbi:MAG: hypothetical protein ACOCXJ_01670 [Planctomycetota bacterium]
MNRPGLRPRRLLLRFGCGPQRSIDLRLLRALLPLIALGLELCYRSRLDRAQIQQVKRLLPMLLHHCAGTRLRISGRHHFLLAIIR